MITLTSDQDPDVRRGAAEALGASDHPEARQALITLTTSDQDPRVRLGAAKALGVEVPEARQALITLTTSDQDPRVRGEAAEALGASDHPEAIVALARVVNDPVVGVDLLRVALGRWMSTGACTPELGASVQKALEEKVGL
jgi:HEAT repeat protein